MVQLALSSQDGKRHRHKSCRWAGTAAEVRQHRAFCRHLAAAEATCGQLAARLGAVEERSSELAARLATVTEGISQHVATVEESNGELVQKNFNLEARVASTERYFGWLLGTVLPGLAKKGQEAAQGAASNGSGDAEPAAASSSDTFDHPNNDKEWAGLVGLHDQAALASVPIAPVRSSPPIGLLFPSHALVSVGMMSAVQGIPAVMDMLRKAGPILGCDVLEVCLHGPEAKFREIDQPLSYIAGLAGLEKLREEHEEAVARVEVMAGFDVGEYVALEAAGVFSFEDGLLLLKLRQKAMREAETHARQRALFVNGLDGPKLVELCVTAEKHGGRDALCQVSSQVFPRGFVVGGTLKSVTALRKHLAEESGVRETRLAGACADHTPLMKPAQERLSAALEKLLPKMKPPRTTVYMNATAAPVRPGTDPKIIAELMKKQVVSCILWEPSVRAMIQEGISEFWEVGQKQKIKGWMAQTSPEVCHNMAFVNV